MTIYNISYRDYLSDTAFRSTFIPATNNNIQIVNFLKNKNTKLNSNNINNQKTTTLKSNSPKPKSYLQNSNKIVYNIDSLKFTRNNFSNAFGPVYDKSICSSGDDVCNSCEDKSSYYEPCRLSVIFNPKIYPVIKEEGINNEWIIDDIEDNPIGKSNQTIFFEVENLDEDGDFDIDIYIKTKYCKEKTYHFFGNEIYADNFTTPEFNSDDFVTEFFFKVSSSVCILNISYVDNLNNPTCPTTETTITTISTPEPTPTTETTPTVETVSTPTTETTTTTTPTVESTPTPTPTTTPTPTPTVVTTPTPTTTIPFTPPPGYQFYAWGCQPEAELSCQASGGYWDNSACTGENSGAAAICWLPPETP